MKNISELEKEYKRISQEIDFVNMAIRNTEKKGLIVPSDAFEKRELLQVRLWDTLVSIEGDKELPELGQYKLF